MTLENTITDTLKTLKRIDGTNLWHKGIQIDLAKPQHATIIIPIPADQAKKSQILIPKIEAKILALGGIETVAIIFTNLPVAKPSDKLSAPNIKNIIAISSGKGGVGKSTIAHLLARNLLESGLKTGLMDADIYGPSLPTLLNTKVRAETSNDKRIQPVMVAGLKSASLGFMVDPQKPVIWRGPMVMRGVEQLFADVDWGDLDYLIIDMPPGTGDAQMTLAQKIPVDAAVVVTTGHALALADAVKGFHMFAKMEVPVLGLFENMSHYTCPHCGEDSHPLTEAGAVKAMAEALDTQYLGGMGILQSPKPADVKALAGTVIAIDSTH